jgi:integrase
MRSSEVLRLEWSALRWNAGVITVTAKVAGKVRVGRKIPIHPALREWLAPWSAHTMGRVIAATPEPSRAISRALSRMCKALGWTHWPINALRHSYGSHRLAAVGFDFAQAANEMGTSPAMLRKHYINPPDPSDVEAYWSIRPARIAGIVPMNAAL